MAITGLIPAVKPMGETLATIPGEYQSILSKILSGQIAQQQNQRAQEEQPLKLAHLKSQTQQANALADWYKRRPATGLGGGTGLKDQMMLMQQAMKDNPGITMDQANNITNAWLNGDATLPDGSPVPEAQGNAATIIDRLSRGRTTAGQINQNLNARQADAELDVLQGYADKGLKPYGNTYFNKSPQQIFDTFKSDETSQKRLGEFIGSQALQFEIAQIRNRIAMGQPGITSTQEMMNMIKQTVDAKYPMLSQNARQIASDYVSKALREGLKERQKVGIRASTAFGGDLKENKNVKKWVVKDGKLVEA